MYCKMIGCLNQPKYKKCRLCSSWTNDNYPLIVGASCCERVISNITSEDYISKSQEICVTDSYVLVQINLDIVVTLFSFSSEKNKANEASKPLSNKILTHNQFGSSFKIQKTT